MKSALRWLVGNLGLILLSLLLAVTVWAVTVEQENPSVERRYSSPIPVAIPIPPEGMIAYGQSSLQVYVTLRAPQSVWDSLRLDDIHASVDLEGLGEGTHQLEVQIQVDRGPVMIRQIEPPAIAVQLEMEQQAAVTVTARIEGDTALGFVAEPAWTVPLTVTVKGPASMVAQVVGAVATVSVEGGRADVEGDFVLEPLDADGEIVPYVDLSPAEALIHVPVEQLSGFRDLAVTALVEGLVAPGYRISSITVDPPVVTAYGTPEAIALIPGYLETIPLDLDGARRDIEIRLPLVAPDGVSLLMEEPVVTVRVAIVPLEGSVTVQRPVEIQGLVGMTATVAPEIVDVILSGPLPVLERLGEEDVRVIADLFGLNLGRHSVIPQIVVIPAGITVESILPASVQVEIVLPTTPAPER